MYKCDEACYDYNNGHICRHIHCVHSSVTQHSVAQSDKASSSVTEEEPRFETHSEGQTAHNGQFKCVVLPCDDDLH